MRTASLKIVKDKQITKIVPQKWFSCYIKKQSPDVFCEKGVLRNYTKFTGKQLCQSLFLNKVAGLKPTTLLKKRLWHRSFPVTFVKFLRTFWRLLLYIADFPGQQILYCWLWTYSPPFASISLATLSR